MKRRIFLTSSVVSFPWLVSCANQTPAQKANINSDVNLAFEAVQIVSSLMVLVPGAALFIPVAQTLELAAQSAYDQYIENPTKISAIQDAFTVGDAVVKIYAALPSPPRNDVLAKSLLEEDSVAQLAVLLLTTEPTTPNIQNANAAVTNLITVVSTQAHPAALRLRARLIAPHQR